MKMKILPALLAAMTLVGATASCSEDNPTFTYSQSNECLITSVTLGKLVRTMHTLSSKGEDSTYTVTVTGSYYPMSIDQANRYIYNLDSLPVGTDISRVTFAALNALGSVSIRGLETGQDSIFNMNDSTDFTKVRSFTVYATDGVSNREYLMRVNVHKEEGDSMVWHKELTGHAELARMTATRSLAVGNQIYLFGMNEGKSEVLISTLNDLDGGRFTEAAMPTQPSVQPQSVVRYHDYFYALSSDSSRLVTSADGKEWTALATDFVPSALVTAGSNQLVALRDGHFYSSFDGLTWTEVAADEAAYLPNGTVCGTLLPSTLDKSFETLIAVGEKDGKAVVWNRNVDLSGKEDFPWIRIPATETSKYNLPEMKEYHLQTYDGAALLTGLTADGKLAPLYWSKDRGRTWKRDRLKTPAAHAEGAIATAIDQNHFIWLFCGKTGEVWRGRINRLGWTPLPGAFEKSLQRR